VTANSEEQSVRIIRLAGWVLGLFGLLVLGDDFVGANRGNNAAGTLSLVAGIATLLYARRREARIDP